MKKCDQWSGLFLLLVAVLICWGSLRMPYGSLHNPGPGFYPFWLGILLAGMSLGLIVEASVHLTG